MRGVGSQDHSDEEGINEAGSRNVHNLISVEQQGIKVSNQSLTQARKKKTKNKSSKKAAFALGIGTQVSLDPATSESQTMMAADSYDAIKQTQELDNGNIDPYSRNLKSGIKFTENNASEETIEMISKATLKPQMSHVPDQVTIKNVKNSARKSEPKSPQKIRKPTEATVAKRVPFKPLCRE